MDGKRWDRMDPFVVEDCFFVLIVGDEYELYWSLGRCEVSYRLVILFMRRCKAHVPNRE